MRRSTLAPSRVARAATVEVLDEKPLLLTRTIMMHVGGPHEEKNHAQSDRSKTVMISSKSII